MRHLDWPALSPTERERALARPPRRRSPDVAAFVKRVFEDVERDGTAAVARWSREVDGRAPDRLELSAAVVDEARARLDAKDVEAIGFAVDQVRFFHEATAPRSQIVETVAGVRCRQVWRPIDTCALYVPAGTAPLVSTLIMLAVPARVAGVPHRVLVSPAAKNGETHPAIIAAAAACGIDEIWRIGGAQAIAALTFGAGPPKSDKIFGPGNAYVAEAKRLATSLPNGPAIDLPAGPSELLIIADGGADPRFIAADLLSQAEHDADAQVLLVSLSAELIGSVEREIDRQIETLPRKEVARSSLALARFILVGGAEAAIEVSNLYGPEHLSLQLAGAERLLDLVRNAGAVFVGGFGAETFGDYVAGPSHVLPTDGAARAWGGISTASFMKSIAVQQFDAAGITQLAEPAARLARLEGLEAHARAAEVRIASLGADPARGGGPAVIRRRRAEIARVTRETKIALSLDLDKRTAPDVRTGIGFYDHMLAQVAQHGGFALTLACEGDLEIDTHHTIEDCAIALGQGLREALGERRGIARFGFVLPMDEAEAKVSIDLGGRPYLVFDAAFTAPLLGQYPTEMTEHVFRSIAQGAGATIHVAVSGDNDHHKTEACFKAFGRVLRQAIAIESDALPSTKGVIE